LMEPKVIIDTEYKKEIRKAEQSLAA